MEISQKIKDFIAVYNDSQIELKDYLNKRIYTKANEDFYNFLHENKGNEDIIKHLLDINYDYRLRDFIDILLIASDEHSFKVKKKVYDYCHNKIQECGNEPEIILKNIQILDQAEVEYSDILRSYSFFIESTYKDISLSIFDKIYNDLFLEKFMDKKKVEDIGNFYLHKLLFSFSSDNDNKNISIIQKVPHSIFGNVMGGENLLLKSIMYKKAKILNTFISIEKKRSLKEKKPDTSLYLLCYMKKGLSNRNIIDFLCKHVEVNAFLNPIGKIPNNIFKKIPTLNFNNSILTNCLSIPYDNSFRAIIELLVENKKLNTEIMYQNEQIKIYDLLKRWCRRDINTVSYIEKKSLEEMIKLNKKEDIVLNKKHRL